jgi:hypothetical protein
MSMNGVGGGGVEATEPKYTGGCDACGNWIRSPIQRYL